MRSSSSPFLSPSGLVDKRLQPMWEQIEQVRAYLPQVAHVSYYLESLFNLERNLSLLAAEGVDHHILKDIQIFQGANAYEIALAEGFVGSAAEWLASLKGIQGDPGVVDSVTLLALQTSIQDNADAISALTLVTDTLSSYTPLSTHNARVTSVNNSLAAIEADVAALQAVVIPTPRTDGEISALAQTVYNTSISSVNSSLGTLSGRVLAAEGLIAGLETGLDAAELAFSTFLTENDTTLTRVTALEGSSTTHNASIISLQSVTAQSASDITLLQAEGATFSAQILDLQTVTSNSANQINVLQVANNANALELGELSLSASAIDTRLVEIENDYATATSLSSLTATVTTNRGDMDAITWTDASYFWDWSAGVADGWGAVNASVSYPSGGGIQLTRTGASTVYIGSGVLSVSGLKHYKVVVDVTCVNAGTDAEGSNFLKLLWSTSGHSYSSSYYDFPRNDAAFVAGERRLLIYDLEAPTIGGSDWLDNIITGIRWNASNKTGSIYLVHSIKVVGVNTQAGLANIITNSAAITEEASVRASADSALATRATNLETTINTPTTGLLARVSTAETAITDGDTANANLITNLTAEVVSLRTQVLPDRPAIGSDFTSSLGSGTPTTIAALTAGTVVNVANEGDVRQFTDNTALAQRGWLPVISGNTYRCRFRVKVAVDGTANQLYSQFVLYNAAGTVLASFSNTTVRASFVAADGWINGEIIGTGAAMLTSQPTAAFVRCRVFGGRNSGGTHSGATWQAAYHRLEDVTELTTLQTTVNTNTADISTEITARVNGDSANATSISNLSASLSKTTKQQFVSNFDNDGYYWTTAFGEAPETVADPANFSYVDVANIGRVAQFSTFARYLTPKAGIKPYVGMKLRLEAKVRATVDPSSGSITAILATINGLSSAWAHGSPSLVTSAVTGYNPQDTALTVADGWVTIARYFTCTAISTFDAGWRPRLDFTHTGSGGTVQVAYFRIEDVTEMSVLDSVVSAAVVTEASSRVSGDLANSTLITNLTAAVGSIRAQALPSRPSIATDFSGDQSGSVTTAADLTAGTVVAVANEGDVRQFTVAQFFRHKGYLPVVSERTYRVRARIKVTVDGTDNRVQVGFRYLDNTYASVGTVVGAIDTAAVVADGWQTLEHVITGATILGTTATAAYVTSRVGVALNSGGTSSGATVQVAWVELEDITDYSTNSAAITFEAEARAGGDQANADDITELSATVTAGLSLTTPISEKGWCLLTTSANSAGTPDTKADSGGWNSAGYIDLAGNLALVGPKGSFPAISGRVYEVTAEIEVTASDGTCNPSIAAWSLLDDYTATSASNFATYEAPAINTGRVTITRRYGVSNTAAQQAVVDPSTVKLLRFSAGIRNGGAGATAKIYSMTVRDVTQEVAFENDFAVTWDDVAYFWDWSTGTLESWQTLNLNPTYPAGGGMIVTQTGANSDIYIRTPVISYSGAYYSKLVVDVECIDPGPTPVLDSRAYWRTSVRDTESASFSAVPRFYAPITAGERKLLVYDLNTAQYGSAEYNSATITRIRIDLPQALGASYRIHSVRIVSPKNKGALSRAISAKADIVTINSAVADLTANKASASSVTALTATVDTIKMDDANIRPAYRIGFTAPANGDPKAFASITFGSAVASANEGQVLAAGGGQNFGHRTYLPILPGRTYRVRARVRATADGTDQRINIGWRWYDASYTYLGVNSGFIDTTFTVAKGWRTLEHIITANSVRAAHPTAAYLTSRLYIGYNASGNSAGGNWEIAWSDIADITDLQNTAEIAAASSALNRNPFFAEGSAQTGVLPQGWTGWSNGTNCNIETRPWGGAGLHAFVPALAGSPQIGWQQSLGQGSVRAGNKYLVRADVARGTGTYAASGVLLQWMNASNGLISSQFISFFAEPDTSGVIATAGDGRRVFEKTFTAPALATNVLIYAMTAWGGFGQALQTTSPQLRWFECSLHQITSSIAGVTELKEALAAGNSSEARLLLRVNTATNAASFEAYAGEGDGVWDGSKISLTADEIELNGDVIVNGSLTTNKLGTNSVTESDSDSNDAAISLSDSTWTDVASVTMTVEEGATVMLTGFMYHRASYTLGTYQNPMVVELRLVRDSTILRTQNAVTYLATVGGPGGTNSSSTGPSTIMDADIGLTAGIYTFKLQAYIDLNATGGTGILREITNRLLVATQLKR